MTVGILKNGTTKWEVTKLENGKYKLTISGNGKMPDFGTGATPWFNYKDQIVEIEVAEGVTAIGRAAFYMLRYVKTVTLPETLTVIGDYAFRNCNSLSTIVIPASVTSIGDEAFAKTKVALQ